MPHHARPPKEVPLDDSTSQRITRAARRHFFVHGLRSVTMDDLAQELGISKKTLYTHFPSKAALLEAVLLDKFCNIEADLDRITSECSRDFVAALHQLLACLQRHTEEIQPPFLRDIRREAPEMFMLVQGRRREVIQRYFGTLLEEGRRAEIIRKDVPVHLVIEILLAAVQAMMSPQRMEELGLTPQSGFSTILTVILEGIITEQGRSKL